MRQSCAGLERVDDDAPTRGPTGIGMNAVRRFAMIAVLALGCGRAESETVQAVVVTPSALDLAGARVDPLADADIAVLVFVTPDCPVSNRYAPELARIAAETPAQVKWWLVYPDPDNDAAAIEAHRQAYALPGTPLRDPDHVLVEKAQAIVTPEAAVFRRDGDAMALAYHGRIDDRVPEYGRARPEPTERELVDALGAVLAGKPVARASAVAVGCPIGDLR